MCHHQSLFLCREVAARAITDGAGVSFLDSMFSAIIVCLRAFTTPSALETFVLLRVQTLWVELWAWAWVWKKISKNFILLIFAICAAANSNQICSCNLPLILSTSKQLITDGCMDVVWWLRSQESSDDDKWLDVHTLEMKHTLVASLSVTMTFVFCWHCSSSTLTSGLCYVRVTWVIVFSPLSCTYCTLLSWEIVESKCGASVEFWWSSGETSGHIQTLTN